MAARVLGPVALAFAKASRRELGTRPATRIANAYLHTHPRSFQLRSAAGPTFVGDTRDLIERYLYLFGVWEPNLTHWVERSLAPHDVFVDVGANVGYFSLLASRRVGADGAVIAIEASPTIFERLQRNIEANAAWNIRALNMAATDARGRVKVFRAPPDNLGLTTTVPETEYRWLAEQEYEYECDVEGAPLHEILRPEEARRARLIKVDVEGAQRAVAEGLLPLLTGAREDIEVLIEAEPRDIHDERSLVDAFARHGLHCYVLENDYAIESYVRYLRTGEVRPPVRLTSQDQLSSPWFDLVFSRVDAPSLAR